MAHVNLSFWRFDYDLTFAALLMNADGTIYHTFAGRDWTDPMSHLTMPALEKLLHDTVAEHEAYQAAPKPPALAKPFTIEQYPTMQRRIKKGDRPSCMHCHMVAEYKFGSLKEAGRYRLEEFMHYPDPIAIGLTLSQEPQTVVEAVANGSAAAKAGLQAGDRIERIGGTRIATFGDVQRVLHETPDKGGDLAMSVRRDDASLEKRLALRPRWKHVDPRHYAWRPAKWAMWPRPGFGGRRLNDGELQAAGLPAGIWALRVGYVVTWGDYSFLGRAAQQAGIRKGTILLATDGKRDFESEAHWQAWFRMTRRLGVPVQLEVWEKGKRKLLKLVPVDR